MLSRYSHSQRKFYLIFILCLIGIWAILQHNRFYLPVPISRHLKNEEKNIPTNEKLVSFPLEELLTSPGYIKQNNEFLIEEIRQKYVKPPSKNNYTLKNPNVVPTWQAKAIKKMFGNKTKGYFVECGANNGEYLSNTLSLEVNDNWSGLLIEADPVLYAALLGKNRKSQTLNACLSPKPYPQKVNFHQEDALGRIIKEEKISAIPVQCFPLYSILLAANRTQVDFFSLDVEGVELDVLRTIPWKDVQISIFTVEFNHVPEGKEAVRKYMEGVGYVMHIDGMYLKEAGFQNVDYIFYHPQYVKIIK